MGSLRDEAQRMAGEISPSSGPHPFKLHDDRKPPQCAKCGDRHFLRLDVPPDDPRFGQAVPCPCTKPDTRERARKMLPPMMRDARFETFDFRENELSTEQETMLRDAYFEAVALADGSSECRWLVLSSTKPGTGKTHLAACIINARLDHEDEWHLPAGLFWNVPELLDRLRGGMGDGTARELLDACRNAPLLVLDDLGAERETDWATEQVYLLVNHRYAHELETVITTNGVVGNPRVRDRIEDVGTGLVKMCVLEIPSYRSGR